MLVDFFNCLRRHGVPCSLTELLDLLAAMDKQVVFADVEAFYTLARMVLVKDERHYDKFDRAFAEYFEGVHAVDIADAIPTEWLENALKRNLSADEKAALQGEGDLEQLLEQFKQRLAEQQERHQGGNKWIGTGGTSPFGAYGYNPEGIRMGQQDSHARRAVKVWDKREFKDLDDEAALNNRSMQLALRKLRRFARTGAADELDLDATIRETSRKGGLLDLQWEAERHNAVKVLIFFDVGGSMDDFIAECEQLFAATRSEFKHLEFFYFHNCIYEGVWRSNKRRFNQQTPLQEVMQTYASDYKVIIVGDATMGPYEIAYPGGSVEHWNEESGAVWMQRLLGKYPHAVWLNPQPKERWPYYQSIGMIQHLMEQRMFPLTLEGLSRAIEELQ